MMDVRSLSSHRNGETEALMITWQKNGLEEDLSESGDTCTSQRDKGRIHSWKPFLVNALRKCCQGPVSGVG